MRKLTTMGSNTHSGVNVETIKCMGDAKIYDSTADRAKIMGGGYYENCIFNEIKCMGEAEIINCKIKNANLMGAAVLRNSQVGDLTSFGDLHVKEAGKIDVLKIFGRLSAQNLECNILNLGYDKGKFLGLFSLNKFAINSYSDINGNICGTTLENRISLKINADIKYTNLILCMPVRANELECENFYSFNKLELQSINAEYIFIKPSSGSKINAINGSKVMVCRDFSVTDEFREIPKSYSSEEYERYDKEAGILDVDTVEADEIYLENVNANCVRGQKIVIGKNCSIKKVEYSIDLEVSKESKIYETVKEDK